MTVVQIVGGLGTVALMVGGGYLTKKYLLVDTYYTKAKEDAEIKDKKVYIGNNESTIKTKLGETNSSYKNTLKDNWSKMEDKDNKLKKPSETPSWDNLSDSEGSSTPTLTQVAEFTNKWCEKKSNLNYNSETNANNTDYETFKAVCFVEQDKSTGSDGGGGGGSQ